MAQLIKVNPTRMELSKLKKRLKTAGDYIWRYIDDESEIDFNYINSRNNK